MIIHNELQTRIERLLQTKIVSYRLVQGGYTPATRLLCQTNNGSFFVKVGSTPLTSAFLRREIRVYHRMRGACMPRLVGSEDHETEPILIIEDLSSYSWPPPWNAQRVELVLARIDEMHRMQIELETYEEVLGPRDFNWHAVAADPAPFLALGMADARWLEAALPTLIDHEERCSTAGTNVTHWDLRSDNMCLTRNGAIFVDWNMACLSNPTLDLGFWLPSLAYEGGPAPEAILPDAPDVAAWVAGFFAARAGLPSIIDAPHVRRVQRQQLEAALPWVVRALDLPTP